MKQIELLKEYCNFESEFDVYVLLGIARKKDNQHITNSQEVVFREIIKSEDNIEKKYTKVLAQCKNYRDAEGKKLNFYIYCSVNARDVRKGYITFKQKMMTYEREIMYGVPCSNQLKRVDSMWLSAIMKPESRAKKRRFMFDLDNKKQFGAFLHELTSYDAPLVQTVETKNGFHIIVNAFDMSRMNKHMVMVGYDVEKKTDGLFFLKHIEAE